MEEKYKIHVCYVIGILISVIVILLTVEWADIPGLKDYISFALTVFSLGLAVLAIVYSMYSNSSLTASLNLLESSSQKLANTSEDLTFATKGLHESLCEIPESLNKVHGEVSKTRDALVQLSSGDQLPMRKQTDDEQRKELVENTLLNLPPYGVVIVAALVLSNKRDFALKVEDHLSDYAGLDPDYFHGVYVTLKAIGIVDGVVTGGDLYKCTYYHSYLTTDKLRELYYKVLDKVFSDKSDDVPEYIIKAKNNFEDLLTP
ncbi:hypothetical protein [Vibrio metoecus]|uniref:hypothetical protein n=1 Tax=Vibrio metoecus TaxID=1481663 RepID=UPI000BA92D86|nr:hypothetical protein [Vibrio metoecus]EIF5160842.1 hypothetical protein [Vibrio cholerae]PAR26913.1 hypothetical protein CGT99_18465 [Vibrio metoecus]